MPPAERSEPYSTPAGVVSAAPKKARKKKEDASLGIEPMFSPAFHIIPVSTTFKIFPLDEVHQPLRMRTSTWRWRCGMCWHDAR